MGYCYVLRCKKDESYYVGSTRNFKKRLEAHKKGKIKYTKSRLPVELVFLKKFSSYSEALKFERKIKSWKKRKSIEKMFGKPDNIADKHYGVV